MSWFLGPRNLPHNHALPANNFFDDVQFDLHRHIAHVLLGHDERSPGVVAGREAAFQRDTALVAVADGGTAGAIGHGNDDVALGRRFPRELPTHLRPHDVDILPEYVAGRIGNVDVLEDTLRGSAFGRLGEELRRHAGVIDGHDLPRQDIANILCVNNVERASFRSHDPGAGVELPQAQWPEAARITYGDHLAVQKQQQTVSALQMAQHVREGIGLGHVRRLGQQVRDDFRIAGRQEDVSMLLIIVSQPCGIDDVAVMRDGHLPAGVVEEQRLGIGVGAGSRRRIAHVSDGNRIGQLFQRAFIEHFVDESHLGVALDGRIAAGGRADAGGFLPAVLLGEQSQLRENRGAGMPEDTEQPAGVFYFGVRHETLVWSFQRTGLDSTRVKSQREEDPHSLRREQVLGSRVKSSD